MTVATDSETRPLLALAENTQHDDRRDDDLERCEGEALSWREWTAEKLEAPRTHKIVILLIAIDASCVLADLVYTFLSPQRDCSNLSSLSPLFFFDASSAQTLEESQPIWLEVLAHISLAINTLFLLEIPLALWCFGFSFYNPFSFSFSWQSEDQAEREDDSDNVESQGPGTGGTEKKKDLSPNPYAALHLFDALVILTTFILEVILRGREAELAGLLVLLRLWRLVKLVGGIAVGAGELQEQLSDQLSETQRLLSEERARRAGLEDEVAQLRARLADTHGLSLS